MVTASTLGLTHRPGAFSIEQIAIDAHGFAIFCALS